MLSTVASENRDFIMSKLIKKRRKLHMDTKSKLEQQTEIIVPDSVGFLRDWLFASFKILETIVIPNSVTSIGDYAFSCCSSLKSINIPDSVISIGKNAFCGCSSLKEIIIPNSVTSIGEKAFYRCSDLEKVVIPDSVKFMGDGVFYFCYRLKTVIIPESVIFDVFPITIILKLNPVRRIKRCWKKMKFRRFFKLLILKGKLKEELGLLPNIGYKYFETKKRFEDMC